MFGSGDLTASIPRKLLLALNLSDSDTLTVILTQPDDGKILFFVETAGTAVTELPGTVIRVFQRMLKYLSVIKWVNSLQIQLMGKDLCGLQWIQPEPIPS